MAKSKKATHEVAQKNIVEAPEKSGVTHTVKVPFADRHNFNKKYEVGEDVSHFDKERLSFLVSEGLAEKVL